MVVSRLICTPTWNPGTHRLETPGHVNFEFAVKPWVVEVILMDTKKCTLLRLDCLACGLSRVLGMIFLPKNRRDITDLTTESSSQLWSPETWQMVFFLENLEVGEHTIYSEWWLENYFHFQLAFLQELMLVLVRGRKTDMVLD